MSSVSSDGTTETNLANILLVDDERDLLDLITMVLRLDGHTVTAMPCSQSAYEFFGSDHPPLDLLLTDVSTRPFSGIELAKRLHRRGFTRPVLFMSGHVGLAGVVAAMPGNHVLLEKPFTASDLRTAVNKVLARKQRT